MDNPFRCLKVQAVRKINVQLTYDDYLKEPMSHRAHELLHTDLSEWEYEKGI